MSGHHFTHGNLLNRHENIGGDKLQGIGIDYVSHLACGIDAWIRAGDALDS
jgi:hypothetical protein